jgi:hypothetical protein
VTETPVDACAVAHGDAPAHEDGSRTLVVVFANPVAEVPSRTPTRSGRI